MRKTVAEYNAGVARKQDAFGRVHLPATITSTVGLAVDRELRVRRGNGAPIPNLYAAGELLGSAQTMGNAAVSGMMVTPALTFGRLLGSRLPLGQHRGPVHCRRCKPMKSVTIRATGS
jgi:fumarate reductase flavoprotein subunit